MICIFYNKDTCFTLFNDNVHVITFYNLSFKACNLTLHLTCGAPDAEEGLPMERRTALGIHTHNIVF